VGSGSCQQEHYGKRMATKSAVVIATAQGQAGEDMS
jgi:hypothetical protein